MTDTSADKLIAVTGEWTDSSYPAIIARFWNGWVVPRVTREVLEDILSDCLDSWKGEWYDATLTLVSVDPDRDEETVVFKPEPDGTYVFDMGWCWLESDFYTPNRPNLTLIAGGKST